MLIKFGLNLGLDRKSKQESLECNQDLIFFDTLF